MTELFQTTERGLADACGSQLDSYIGTNAPMGHFERPDAKVS